MKKINPAEMTANTLGILCGLAILGGGASLILGSSGSILIWTGDRLKPHQHTFRHMGFYGSLFCGGGFLLVGAASPMLQGAAQRAIAQYGSGNFCAIPTPNPGSTPYPLPRQHHVLSVSVAIITTGKSMGGIFLSVECILTGGPMGIARTSGLERL
jgi:hypothetical protein